MNVSFSAVLALPAATPALEHAYGDAPEQFLQVHLPPGDGPHPVVVLLHGGCWLSRHGVNHTGPMATALAEAGFAVIAPEYRRIGDAGGGWPGTFRDVARALDGLPDLPVAGRLDLERVALAGHSAGGHLALWLAARGGLPADHELHPDEPFVPAQVVGLAAITDLEAYVRGGSGCGRAAGQLMGGGPGEHPDRYALASPVRLPPPAPEVTLIQGTADPIVPAGQAQAYVDAMAAASGRVHMEWVRGAGHFDAIHPRTAAFERLLSVLAPLLETPR